MDSMRALTWGVTILGAIAIVSLIYSLGVSYAHETDYGLGKTVTTTSEYEYLTNDSFTGVVVRGETRDDPALTVRNRDGTERRIATEFLEPKR